MKHLSTLLLALLLVAVSCMAQSRHVSYRSTKHYNRKVAQFEQNNDVDSTKIVMLGDSETEFARDWNKLLGTTNVVNYGIMGDGCRGIGKRLHQVTLGRPKAVFLMCGINDVSARITAERLSGMITAIVDSIRSQSPTTQVFVQSILPINMRKRAWSSLLGQEGKIRQINALLLSYCLSNGITYIDIYHNVTAGQRDVLDPSLTDDGLHVNRTGYKIWAETIKPYIDQCNNE